MSNFYPRSPCGERRVCYSAVRLFIKFLSTLSLRRATQFKRYINRHLHISIHALLAESDLEIPLPCLAIHNFYPRSPCGERRYLINTYHRIFGISIHALLAESDACLPACVVGAPISIHALLAESDAAVCKAVSPELYFYPRSPCGERRPRQIVIVIIDNFYPRSPCGERPVITKPLC